MLHSYWKFALLLIVWSSPALCVQAREWLDATGKHRIQAELVAVRGDKVILEKPDGMIITVPLEKLSAADQAFAKSQMTKSEPAAQPLPNAAASKPSSGSPAPTSPPAATPPAMPTSGDQLALAERSEEILRKSCYRCHGEEGANEGGFNFVSNMEKLARTIAKPGKPAESQLLERMIAKDEGVMPPLGENPRPSAEDVETIRAWIAAGSFVKPNREVRPFMTNDQVVQAIDADVQKQSERARRFMRYFTLTHLYNAGVSEEELQTYRNAFTKLINSLSWNTSLINPRPIDAARTIMGIDMRDLHWNSAMWQSIEKSNPYFLKLASPNFRSCVESTQTQMPYVRIDWFVFAASKPPLYHVLLNLPETDAGLEDLLRVNVAANIDQEQVIRAAFNRSGVSQNNRLIEWHKSPYGSYWKSYDFGGSTGEKNLFQYPLGPSGAQQNFKHDGGEIIFSLPNGLQGYLLVDEAGKRIDQGPTSIVSDPKRPDKTVTNGVSCMSCHYTGVIPKRDEVGGAVRANRNAFDEAEDILALYRDPTELDAVFDKDGKRFAESLQELGITSLSRSGEPISAMAANFDQEIDLPQVACEFGLATDDFKDRLTKTKDVARVFSSLLIPGGTMKRDVFKELFTQAAVELKLKVDIDLDIRFGSEPASSNSSSTTVADARPRPARSTGPIDGSEVARFSDLTWGVKSLAFSPNGKFLAAGRNDRSVNLFDVPNQSQAGTLEKQELLGQVSCIEFSPDGKVLIAGGSQGQILVFSVSSEGLLEQVGQFAGHSNDITAIAVSSDGNYVLSGSEDKKACFWELSSGSEIAAMPGFQGKIKAVHIGRNNRTLHVTDGAAYIEFDVTKKEIKKRRMLTNSWAAGQAAAIAPDGETIAVGDSYNIRIWNLETGRELQPLVGNEIQWSMAFTPDGSRLLSGGNAKVNVWDVKKSQRLHVQSVGESSYVQSLAVSKDGKMVASPGSHRELTVFRLTK